METQTSKMNFIISRPVEFLYAIIATSLGEKVIGEADTKYCTELIASVKDIKQKLSRFTQMEMEYFFDMDVNILDGFGQIILWSFLLDNPNTNTVSELISLIENCNESILFYYIIKYMVLENKHTSIDHFTDYEKLKDNIEGLLGIANNLEFPNTLRKEKLIECISNSTETKHRLCLLLNQFYEKAYKPVEEAIIKILLNPREKYEAIFNADPHKFSKEFLFKDYGVFSSIVDVHVSYFRHVGSDYYSNKDNNELIVFGYRTDEFFGEAPKREKIYKFLKAISDKKRIDIIELLSQKPWYVNEIADELGMTSATVSYHLTTLQELDIVDFERSDHRFYYHLNKDILSNFFDEAKELFLRS